MKKFIFVFLVVIMSACMTLNPEDKLEEYLEMAIRPIEVSTAIELNFWSRGGYNHLLIDSVGQTLYLRNVDFALPDKIE